MRMFEIVAAPLTATRASPLPGIGMENTDLGRPVPVAPTFALRFEPGVGPRLRPSAPFIAFFSPPAPVGIAPAPAPRCAFALGSPALALRRLFVPFSPNCLRFIQRTLSATSRTPFAGRRAAIFT